MARKPESPQQPTSWIIFKLAAKAERLGTVEAAAIEKAAAEFKAPANRLMAVLLVPVKGEAQTLLII
jgi:hypothetical protein